MMQLIRNIFCMLLVAFVPSTLQEVVPSPGCDATTLNCQHGGPSQNNINNFNNLLLLDLGKRTIDNATQFSVAALVSTMYAPSVIVFEAPAGTKSVKDQIAVNWKSLLDGTLESAITVPGIGASGSVFGITFARLLEFTSNETSNTFGKYTKLAAYNLSQSTDFHWQQAKVANDKPDYATIAMQTTPDSKTNLTFLISAWPAAEGRDADPPRLQHTPTTLQIQLLSNNTRLLANSAYAVELNVVAYVKNGGTPPDVTKLFRYDKYTILDDEQSPGVFSSALLRLDSQWGADRKPAEKHGFLMWKPVAYSDVVKNTESVLVTKTYPFMKRSQSNSIADALNLEGVGGGQFYQASFTLSFGESGQTSAVGDVSYNSWTALIGVGEEKYDPISVGVIMAILFGLGVPIVMLILVGGYLIIWKRRNRRQPIVSVENRGISGPNGSDL